MAFELYAPSDPRFAGQRGSRFVRFHKGGLYVSSDMARQIGFNEFDRARVYFDRENGLVAFQLTNEPMDGNDAVVGASRTGTATSSVDARSINSTGWAREAIALGYQLGAYYTLKYEVSQNGWLWMVMK